MFRDYASIYIKQLRPLFLRQLNIFFGKQNPNSECGITIFV